MSDPVKRSKITSDVQSSVNNIGFTKHTKETRSISLNFTEEELIDILLKYIEKGIAYDLKGWGRVKWTGLDELLP
jgi:vacuolar-type H+-ATPase subunit E/Vma4